MNKKLFVIFLIIFLGLSLAVYQYAKEFQAEFTNAAYSTSKPVNGHSWSEMECTSDLCVKTGTGIGLGTDSPTNKLSVVGDIGATGSVTSTGNISTSGSVTATGDVCGAGACLSQIASFVANQPLVNNVHNQAACTAAGGTIVPSDVSYPQCRFNAASCPSGWSQYKEFAKLDGVFCYGGPSGYNCYSSCTPSSGSWGSPAGAVGGCQVCYGPGVDQYGSGICNCGICASSVRVQIGCY